jgi:hypothetical protein
MKHCCHEYLEEEISGFKNGHIKVDYLSQYVQTGWSTSDQFHRQKY